MGNFFKLFDIPLHDFANNAFYKEFQKSIFICFIKISNFANNVIFFIKIENFSDKEVNESMQDQL